MTRPLDKLTRQIGMDVSGRRRELRHQLLVPPAWACCVVVGSPAMTARLVSAIDRGAGQILHEFAVTARSDAEQHDDFVVDRDDHQRDREREE